VLEHGSGAWFILGVTRGRSALILCSESGCTELMHSDPFSHALFASPMINDGGPLECGQTGGFLTSDTVWSSDSPLRERGLTEMLISYNELEVGIEVACSLAIDCSSRFRQYSPYEVLQAADRSAL
jgi:hypothetical protein